MRVLYEKILLYLLFDVLSGINVAVTDKRYFASSKLCRSLVRKTSFSLIWRVVFKLGCVFCQER